MIYFENLSKIWFNAIRRIDNVIEQGLPDLSAHGPNFWDELHCGPQKNFAPCFTYFVAKMMLI
jgi:hypothetical protein